MAFNWNIGKNEQLQRERGISFTDVISALNQDKLLIDIEHPNTEDYPHQRIFIVEIQGYAYQVPYVIEEDGTHFLKTVFPSRAATKKYLSH